MFSSTATNNLCSNSKNNYFIYNPSNLLNQFAFVTLIEAAWGDVLSWPHRSTELSVLINGLLRH